MLKSPLTPEPSPTPPVVGAAPSLEMLPPCPSIVWIVGINGGNTYDSRKDMVYVGREGPEGSAEQTFRIMMTRFNPETSN